MVNIVDSLVVSLKLDNSQFKQEAARVPFALSDITRGAISVEAALKKMSAVEGAAFLKRINEEGAKVPFTLNNVSGAATSSAKELEARGKQAAQFFSAMKVEALGLIGVLTGTAGLGLVARNTAESLANLGRQAVNIGESVPALAAFRNMIERNGGSAESASASLKGYADAIERFKVFGDASILQFLNPIGADVNDSPLEAYKKFVKFVEEHKNLPGGAQLINLEGRGLGYDQDLINSTIQIGSLANANKQLADEMNRVPTEQMTQNARQLQSAWEDLEHQAKFTGQSIEDSLTPAMVDVLKLTKDEIAEHPKLVAALLAITTGLTTLGAVRILASTMGLTGVASTLGLIQTRILAILGPLGLLALTGPAGGEDPEFSEQKNEEYRRNEGDPNTGVGGWLRRHLPSWMTGANLSPAQPDAPSSGGGDSPTGGNALDHGTVSRAREIYNGLIGRGFDSDTAWAFAGNAVQESRADPHSRPGDMGAAHGAFMWRDGRVAEFQRQYGHLPEQGTLDEQLDFLKWELEHSERGAAFRIAGAQGVSAKAKAVSQFYERPKDTEPEKERRATIAAALAHGAAPAYHGEPVPTALGPRRFLTPDQIEGPPHPSGAWINIPTAPDPALNLGPSARTPGGGPQSSNTDNSSAVSIGSVHISTAATDASGIARDLHSELMVQATRGLS